MAIPNNTSFECLQIMSSKVFLILVPKLYLAKSVSFNFICRANLQYINNT